MCASVLIVHSDAGFKDSIDESLSDSFSGTIFSIVEDELITPKYNWINEEFFDADLDVLYEFCKQHKLKLKGSIFIVRRESERDDAETIQYQIKLGSKDYESVECNFSVTVRRESNKKRKVFTENDKLALYKEYWDTKKKIPPPKEVYKEFRIGAFYNTCKRNENIMKAIDDIQKDNP